MSLSGYYRDRVMKWWGVREDGTICKMRAVPEGSDFWDPRSCETIRDIMFNLGCHAIVSCPAHLPGKHDVEDSPELNRGKPLATRLNHIHELPALTPPAEFLDQRLPDSSDKFSVGWPPPIEAWRWNTRRVLVAHRELHCRVHGLAHLVDMSTRLSFMPRGTNGIESELCATLYDRPGGMGIATLFHTWEQIGGAVSPTSTPQHLENQVNRGLISRIESLAYNSKGNPGNFSQPIALGVMASPPVSLQLVAFNRKGATGAVSCNALPPSVNILDHQGWVDYFSAFNWITFVWMVSVSDEFATRWSEKFPETGPIAVAKAREVTAALNKACEEGFQLRIQRVVGAFVLAVLSCLWLWLMRVVPAHWVLPYFSRIWDESLHDEFSMTPRGYFSIGQLNVSGARVIQTERIVVYIYEQLGLVVKVYPEYLQEDYARELAAYEACSALQGTAIPRIYSVGKRRCDGCIALAMSYEGEPVETLTGPILTQLQSGPLKQLHAYVHHHDLAKRNIVVNAVGQVKLIDLGHAVRKEDCEGGGACPDEWFLKSTMNSPMTYDLCVTAPLD